jgi:hypothetical protein
MRSKSLLNQVRVQPLDESWWRPTPTHYVGGIGSPPSWPDVKASSTSDRTVTTASLPTFEMSARNIPAYEVFVSGMQATVLAFWANARHGVPNTEDERLCHAVYLMDSDISLAQVRRSAWSVNGRCARAGTRARPTGGRTRSACCATSGTHCCRRCGSAADDRYRRGFPAGAMLAHRARLSTSETVQLVSEVNGTKSGARQAAVVKNIDATVYIDRIRELAGGIAVSRPGRGRGPKPRLGMALGSLGALPEDLTSLASLYQGPERREVATRCRSDSGADAGAARKARPRDGVRGRILERVYELLADDELHDNEAATGTLDGLRPQSVRRCAASGDGPTG